MGRRGNLETTPTIEKLVISDYVRLCTVEGIKPGNAYRKMERRLKAAKELRNPKTV
jgi:hypothetical protein